MGFGACQSSFMETQIWHMLDHVDYGVSQVGDIGSLRVGNFISC